MLSVFLFACGKEKASENTSTKTEIAVPNVLDKRLELSLFAADPDIVTPIGIAIDSLNRIFILESHTHLRPKKYAGPDSDQVKIFEDTNDDGKPDKIAVFADGLTEGLNMAFAPDGNLYVVTSRAVWVLFDRNKDGVSEARTKVVELIHPEKVYAHAALLSITFSHDGWMYLSRGNTGSAAWKLQGTDSSSVSGYGDGGNIVRAHPDGTKLEEVATGFWNPVDLKFDSRGRLLAADNDPDSRGPNRLLHILPGGDYGYQSRYGNSGIHPYLAWNGELAGTLPYAVGLGEAPFGLLDANLTALPTDYQNQMLSTIWEESRIVLIGFEPQGVSVKGTTEVIVEGDQQFRPVAFAADRKGNIYITDWVLRDYPNHGKGRIWKLSARDSEPVLKPRQPYSNPLPDPHNEALQAIYATHDISELTKALHSNDPFIQHAAVTLLAKPAFRQHALEATQHIDADVRLGAAIALQRSGYPKPVPIVRRLLTDADARIRQRALIWAGQAGLKTLLPVIYKAVSARETTPVLFETYLETIRHLNTEYIEAYSQRTEPYAKSIKRELPPEFIEDFIQDKSRPASLRALAIQHLENPGEQASILIDLLNTEKYSHLRLEVLRSLAAIPGEDIARQLLKIATTSTESSSIRAWALLALARQPPDMATQVITLLQDPEMDIRIEAARYLRTRLASEEIQKAFKRANDSVDKEEEALQEQIILAISSIDSTKINVKRPVSPEEWQEAVGSGGVPARGYRVMYSLQSMCSMCHAFKGRGGTLGPDLTNTGQSKSRTQLIQSILQPSTEVSPEYQGWFIHLKNGEVYQGRQIDIGDNSVELYTQGRGFVTFDKGEVEDYKMSEKSLMPDGLEKQLTVSDLRDLLAFLEAKQATISNKKEVAYIKK